MKVRIFIVIGIILSALLFLMTERPKLSEISAPKTILFVGNSFTNYNNSLHHHVRELAVSLHPPEEAKKFFFKAITISGGHLSDHVIGAKGMIMNHKSKKKKGPWDVVVLQGHSKEPIKAKKIGRFRASAAQLDAWIRDAGSKTVLFMTWAYKHKPEMAQPLAEAYTQLGYELDALVVPVGLAFELARIENPEMELYTEDRVHPSLLGTYLAANVFVATLYRLSPVGASYWAGLHQEEAEFAQQIAWKTVQTYFGIEVHEVSEASKVLAKPVENKRKPRHAVARPPAA